MFSSFSQAKKSAWNQHTKWTLSICIHILYLIIFTFLYLTKPTMSLFLLLPFLIVGVFSLNPVALMLRSYMKERSNLRSSIESPLTKDNSNANLRLKLLYRGFVAYLFAFMFVAWFVLLILIGEVDIFSFFSFF